MNEEPSIFLFKSELDLEEAITNWLGDQFDEDEPLTVLEVAIPTTQTKQSKALYEVQVMNTIDPSCIKIIHTI